MHFTGEMHSFHPALKKYTHRRNSTMPQNTTITINIIHLKIILSRDFYRNRFFTAIIYVRNPTSKSVVKNKFFYQFSILILNYPLNLESLILTSLLYTNGFYLQNVMLKPKFYFFFIFSIQNYTISPPIISIYVASSSCCRKRPHYKRS